MGASLGKGTCYQCWFPTVAAGSCSRDQVVGFIFFPFFQGKKKKKNIYQNQTCLWETAPKHFLTREKVHWKKKKKSFQVFLMEGKTFGEVTTFCGKRLTKGKRLKCKEIFQMFPEQPFLVKQKHSSQAFPNFLLCSSVWERKCLEISMLLCRQERPRFLCAMPRAAGQQEHSGEAAGILCRQGRAAACRE